MSLHDISLKLAGDTVRWVTAPPFELEERRRMSKGDPNNSSALNMSGHSGTHIDAPFHFVAEGLTIDDLPLDRFIGPGLVFEADAARYITKEHVESIKLDGATRVLFKTRNSELLHQREYEPDFVAFSVEAAQSMVEQGVELMGLDYLSIAHADEQVRVHRAFLDRGVVLFEGIDLSHVPPGRYELMCLP
nr:cyclase family protein [Dehalococcoidia bacterium]